MSTLVLEAGPDRRITPYTARPEVFFGDTCDWTLTLPTPHQEGDTYAIALDHDSIIWPLADALVDAGTDIATVSEDGKSVSFSFGLLSDRMRQWISGVERAMPMIVQAVRYRDGHAETLLSDVILARPVAIGGPIATGPQEDPDLDTLTITLTTDPETGAQTLTLAQYGGETIVHLPPADIPAPVPATEAQIDARTGDGLVTPTNLDYAVRSVLSNITDIPAATTAYTLTDASATTNSHSYTYTHAPSAAPTYTLPAVSSTTVLHEIILEVTFSANVLTYAFQDSAGNAVTPLATPDIQAGSVVVFLCRYSAAIGGWYIMPIPIGTAPAQS